MASTYSMGITYSSVFRVGQEMLTFSNYYTHRVKCIYFCGVSYWFYRNISSRSRPYIKRGFKSVPSMLDKLLTTYHLTLFTSRVNASWVFCEAILCNQVPLASSGWSENDSFSPCPLLHLCLLPPFFLLWPILESLGSWNALCHRWKLQTIDKKKKLKNKLN